MPIAKSKSLVRPVVARDGSIYWIRRMHAMGRSQGVYLPRQIIDALHIEIEDALQVWAQGDVVMIKRLEVVQGTKLIPIPPRGRRSDSVPPDDEA